MLEVRTIEKLIAKLKVSNPELSEEELREVANSLLDLASVLIRAYISNKRKEKDEGNS